MRRRFRAGPPFCVSMEVRSIERQARVTCQGTKENRPAYPAATPGRSGGPPAADRPSPIPGPSFSGAGR